MTSFKEILSNYSNVQGDGFLNYGPGPYSTGAYLLMGLPKSMAKTYWSSQIKSLPISSMQCAFEATLSGASEIFNSLNPISFNWLRHEIRPIKKIRDVSERILNNYYIIMGSINKIHRISGQGFIDLYLSKKDMNDNYHLYKSLSQNVQSDTIVPNLLATIAAAREIKRIANEEWGLVNMILRKSEQKCAFLYSGQIEIETAAIGYFLECSQDQISWGSLI